MGKHKKFIASLDLENQYEKLEEEYKLHEVKKELIKKLKKNNPCNEEYVEKIKEHSKHVVVITNEIVDRSKDEKAENKKPILLKAALLHDICKIDEDDYDYEDCHHEEGKQYIKNHDISNLEEKDLIAEIIVHHRNGESKLRGEKILLGDIVYAADKTCKMFKKKNWNRKGKIKKEKEKINKVDPNLREVAKGVYDKYYEKYLIRKNCEE